MDEKKALDRANMAPYSNARNAVGREKISVAGTARIGEKIPARYKTQELMVNNSQSLNREADIL